MSHSHITTQFAKGHAQSHKAERSLTGRILLGENGMQQPGADAPVHQYVAIPTCWCVQVAGHDCTKEPAAETSHQKPS